MKLEDQVCSLELAKKLKELGVKKESLFYWADGELVIGTDVDLLLENNKTRSLAWDAMYIELDNFEIYSAFTVAELGEMIPYCYNSMRCNGKDSENKEDFYVCYDLDEGFENSQSEKTEANARAKMLIYLIENKFIEI